MTTTVTMMMTMVMTMMLKMVMTIVMTNNIANASNEFARPHDNECKWCPAPMGDPPRQRAVTKRTSATTEGKLNSATTDSPPTIITVHDLISAYFASWRWNTFSNDGGMLPEASTPVREPLVSLSRFKSRLRNFVFTQVGLAAPIQGLFAARYSAIRLMVSPGIVLSTISVAVMAVLTVGIK